MENENTTEFELIRKFESAITTEHNNQISEINNVIDFIEKTLCSDDSIQKLENLAYLQTDIVSSREKWYTPYLTDIKSEIEKLEILNRNGLLKQEKPKSDQMGFNTIFKDNVERESFCYKIIEESASGKPNYTKTFIGSIDMPTLMYLLGGERPPEIRKIQMAGSHQKVYDLLLNISSHTFKGNICVPNFVKKIICQEVLLNKNGKAIKKLNENVPVK